MWRSRCLRIRSRPRNSGCPDPHVRTGFRCAFQPGRDTGRSVPARIAVARSAGLCGRAALRRLPRGWGCPSHVWRGGVQRFASREVGRGAGIQRVRGHVRPDGGDLGLHPPSARVGAVRGWRVYCGRILVHRIHFICAPPVTLARSASDTFAGIRPADAPGFILAQLAGAAATWLFRWLTPSQRELHER